MDGENNGKPYELSWMIWGVCTTPIFGSTPTLMGRLKNPAMGETFFLPNWLNRGNNAPRTSRAIKLQPSDVGSLYDSLGKFIQHMRKIERGHGDDGILV